MTDNEKLIEEARELVASWDRRGSWDADSPVGMVMRLADALAVFEKAHANASDLPKADISTGQMSAFFRGWDAAVDGGFRRSEVPEPSVDDLIATRAGLALANAAWHEGASATLRSVNEHDDDASSPGMPWSKPISPYSGPLLARIREDKQPTILGGEGCYCEPTGYEPVTGHGGSCPLAEPQGEPSDALSAEAKATVIEDAMDEIMQRPNVGAWLVLRDIAEQYRAAVTEQGENR